MRNVMLMLKKFKAHSHSHSSFAHCHMPPGTSSLNQARVALEEAVLVGSLQPHAGACTHDGYAGLPFRRSHRCRRGTRRMANIGHRNGFRASPRQGARRIPRPPCTRRSRCRSRMLTARVRCRSPPRRQRYARACPWQRQRIRAGIHHPPRRRLRRRVGVAGQGREMASSKKCKRQGTCRLPWWQSAQGRQDAASPLAAQKCRPAEAQSACVAQDHPWTSRTMASQAHHGARPAAAVRRINPHTHV